MDVSDGLARDGARLARASEVDLVLDVALLPPLPAGVALDEEGRLAGGEEHELMVLVSPSCEERFTARGFVRIGYAEACAAAPEIRFVRRGAPVVLTPRPYEHF
jgi:thiamine-monophosphate kinase